MYLITLSGTLSTEVDERIYNNFVMNIWFPQRARYGYYAVRKDRIRGKIYLHREIMLFYGHDINGKIVDHKDKDGLNNLYSNLRIASTTLNGINKRMQTTNKSGYRGVCWDHREQKWRATINVYGKQIHLGYFDDIIEAALAYDRAARIYHKEDPQLNFPDIVS